MHPRRRLQDTPAHVSAPAHWLLIAALLASPALILAQDAPAPEKPAEASPSKPEEAKPERGQAGRSQTGRAREA